MLRASDFIDLNISDIERERRRVRHLIASLPQESAATRRRLAMEFIGIVQDRDQSIGRRANAACLLACSPRQLEITGSRKFLGALLHTIEAEFSGWPDLGLSRGPLAANNPALVRGFLHLLVLSVFGVNREAGRDLAAELASRTRDPEVLARLRRVRAAPAAPPDERSAP
jgi:hypothetical protein